MHVCIITEHLQQSFISKHFVSCIYFCTFSLSLWATTLTESSEVMNSQWDTDDENDVCEIEENLPFFCKYITDSMINFWVCLLFNLSSAGLLLCSELCGSAGGSKSRGSRNKYRPDYNWCGSQKNHWASVRNVQVSPLWFLHLNWRLFNICDVYQSSSLGIHAELKTDNDEI